MEILSNQFFPKRLTKYAQYGIAAYGIYTEGKKAYDWVQGIIELQRDKHSYTVLIKNSELLEALTKYVVDRESVVDN